MYACKFPLYCSKQTGNKFQKSLTTLAIPRLLFQAMSTISLTRTTKLFLVIGPDCAGRQSLQKQLAARYHQAKWFMVHPSNQDDIYSAILKLPPLVRTVILVAESELHIDPVIWRMAPDILYRGSENSGQAIEDLVRSVPVTKIIYYPFMGEFVLG